MNYWFDSAKRPILALAPMHQVSRSSLRQACRKYGADATYSEMVAAEAVIRRVPQTFEMLKFTEIERPFIVQIFGNKPEIMAQAAALIEEEIKPDGIDINFGCPVQKAEKQGFGACQLKDPEAAGEIVRAIASVLKTLPLSAKIRIPDVDLEISLKFVEEIYKNGIKLISIHGRSPSQKYGGEANWNFAYEVKNKFPNLIVLGNGDIKNLENLKSKIGNLDGAMIGRSAKVHPEVFSELVKIKSVK